MPAPAESLNKDSKEEAVIDAIEKTISQLVSEGFEQDQAVAIAHEMAQKATGRQLNSRGPRSAR